MQDVKRQIIKKATKGAKKGMPPVSSRTGAQSSSATLGVYRTGPWSDSLGTTTVSVPKAPEKASGFGQGGPGLPMPGFGVIGQMSKKKVLNKGKGGPADNVNAAASATQTVDPSSTNSTYSDPTLQLDPMSDYYYNPSLVNPVGSGNYLNTGIQTAMTQGQQGVGSQGIPLTMSPMQGLLPASQSETQKQAQTSDYPQPQAGRTPGTPVRTGTSKVFTSRAPVILAMRKFPGSALNMPSVSAQRSKYNRMPNVTKAGQSPRGMIIKGATFKNRNPKTLTNKSYAK